MPSPEKEMMLQEVVKELEANPYAFISTFEKMTVADLSHFRRSVGKVSKRSLMVKHTLAKKVFGDRRLDEASKFLKSAVLMTFGDKDPQMISKAIVTFAKDHKELTPAACVFENEVRDTAFVKQLARLPSREELLTQVVVRVKSPISGFVSTLGQLSRGLVVVLNQIREQKAGQAPAA